MSVNPNNRQKYSNDVVKSKGAGSVTQRDVKKAHNAAFGDLFQAVEKETGLPGDEVLYKDPFGFKAGDPVYYPQKMFEGVGGSAGWEDAFHLFNQEQAKGAEVRESARTVAKSMGRSSYSLPIFVSPEVYVSTRKDLPLADMLPRVAVQADTVHADEQVEVGDASSFEEGGVWAENDDEYVNHTYEIVPYGRQNAVTDFVQLAAGSLRSTRSITEESQNRAIRKYEENQMIQGTVGNDPDGFRGLRNFAEATGKLEDPVAGTGGEFGLEDVYDQNRRLKRSGASRESIIHVTDHTTFGTIQKELKEYARWDADVQDLDFGFEGLSVGGTRIFESHGVPDAEGSREFWSLDAAGFDMAMLQDTTMHPLAKTDATENFATDAYGTFRANGVSHLFGVENIA